jgi:hypothetical protein
MGEPRRPVRRVRFDHLAAELSVAVGALVPRWPLWLRLHELGQDPEHLSSDAALAFCGGPARRFLAEHGLGLSWRARRRLLRSVAAFDPERASPEQALGFVEPDEV